MTKTQELEVVAWTNDSALALLREHWPMVAVLPTSYEQTPLYPIALVTLSATSAIIKGLEERIEALMRERTSLIETKREQLDAAHAQLVHAERDRDVNETCRATWQSRAEAAEAERDALRKALKPFSDMGGEMFARGWDASNIALALDNPDDPHRVTAGDFFTARQALSGSKEK